MARLAHKRLIYGYCRKVCGAAQDLWQCITLNPCGVQGDFNIYLILIA